MKKKERLRIAVVRGSTSFQSITSYNSQELGLAKALLKKGIQTDIFYASAENKASVLIDEGVKIYYLPVIKLGGQQGIMLGINYHIKKNNYDLIQVSEESSLISFFAAVYARKKRIPVVLFQGMYEGHKKGIAALLQKVYNFFFLKEYRKSVSAVICKTNKAKDYLSSKKFSNIHVIPVGLSIEKFTNLHKSIPKPSKHIVLYVGKLEKRRNPKFTMELAKQYLQNKEVTFVCVGKGPLAEEIKKIKPQNVEIYDCVTQDNIKDYYDMADVLLMPTDYEIFGMVYLEAIYFGVPIVSTENAGSLDLLKGKAYAVLEKKLDVCSWKENIDSFLFDNESIIKAKKQLEIDRTKVTWDSVVNRYSSIYKNISNHPF